jgi:hypothetical protein
MVHIRKIGLAQQDHLAECRARTLSPLRKQRSKRTTSCGVA